MGARYLYHRRMTNLPWSRTDAACRDASTPFFPDEDTTLKLRRAQEADAKEICLSCPILDMCRQYAIINEEYGVWGGTTADERKMLRRSVSQADQIEYRRLGLIQTYAPILRSDIALMTHLDGLVFQSIAPLPAGLLEETDSLIDELLADLLD